MRAVRAVHRTITFFVVCFTLYIGTTGCLVQLVDLRAILSGAPAISPNMQAIHESIDGREDFAVIQATDYASASLPIAFDADAAIRTSFAAARGIIGSRPVDYVDLRMQAGLPVASVLSNTMVYQFDPHTGQNLATIDTTRQHQGPQPSLHNRLKWLHRFFDDGYLWINMIVGVGLFGLIMTGLWQYYLLMAARARLGRRNVFWSGAATWRTLHRAIALLAAAFLVVVSVTGTWLSFDSFARGRYAAAHPSSMRSSPADGLTPLAAAALPGMLRTGLAAYQKANPDRPIKAIRLRTYANYPQVVVIAGGNETSQLVYNGTTGDRMSATEPGYPVTAFPFGWQLHETIKRIHRGDYFGLPGRLMDLFAGLSLVFLSLSGLVMYSDLWRKRRRTGRVAPVWL